jgi:hypothetical protein
MGMQYMEYVMRITGQYVEHAGNVGEFKIPNPGGRDYHADGFERERKRVRELHGCYHHGCETCYSDRNAINQLCGKTFGELHEATMRKRDNVISLGYEYSCIWEHEWIALMKQNGGYAAMMSAPVVLSTESLSTVEAQRLVRVNNDFPAWVLGMNVCTDAWDADNDAIYAKYLSMRMVISTEATVAHIPTTLPPLLPGLVTPVRVLKRKPRIRKVVIVQLTLEEEGILDELTD